MTMSNTNTTSVSNHAGAQLHTLLHRLTATTSPRADCSSC